MFTEVLPKPTAASAELASDRDSAVAARATGALSADRSSGGPNTPRKRTRSAGSGAPKRRSRLSPYLYVLPACAMLLVWTYIPLARTFELSFYDWNLLPTQPKTPVGFDNYSTVATLPEMHQALWNTLLYIGAFMVISVVLPVIFALVARRVDGRAKKFFQALIFVPFLVTPVATGAIWRWLFAPVDGTIPQVVSIFGFEMGDIFRNPDTSLLAVVIIVGWGMLGFGVLVVSAGISGISPDYAQAASTDGANEAQITWRITLPLLSPSLVFLALMTILLSAQWTFPIIDLTTGGGPSNSSTNIYYLLYQFGFANFDAGLSAAAGVLFFIGFGLIALIFVELSEKLSFHDN